MSQQAAEKAIQSKRQALEATGMQLGDPQGPVQSAGSGGFVQMFQNVNIYWHANTGAHEVHGNILETYLRLGGPGNHPDTGQREFGYPRTDEEHGFLGAEMSQFEFGIIYNVSGLGAVGVFGHFATRFNVLTHGLPITAPIQLPAGEVLYCQEGCVYTHPGFENEPLHATFILPQLGRPTFIQPTSRELPVKITMRISTQRWNDLLLNQGGLTAQRAERLLTKLGTLWDNRFRVQSVQTKGFSESIRFEVQHDTHPTHEFLTWTGQLPDGVELPNRRLYDVVFRTPVPQIYVIAPHALYTTRDWERFGFLHITDLHVSRRVESFRRQLKEAGRDDSARLMVNPNDSVRALINYANELHARDHIDFILATGDLIDYVFEKGDHHNAGGNFRYLERLIRGEAPSRDDEGVENNELRVPIFTVLGNHDYVVNPYDLYFDIDIPVVSDSTVKKWGGFNMVRADAEALQGGHKRTVSRDTAAAMAKSDRKTSGYYDRKINRKSSYVIELGDAHRIIMLDTGPNADVLDGDSDALEEFFGFSNENESSFVRGVPNSASSDLKVLRDEMKKPAPSGITIIGMHNPPLNILGNEFAYYFRESHRTHMDDQRLKELVLSYLSRQSIAAGHVTWLRTNSAHFKTGSTDDLLDFGVVKWLGGTGLDFLRLCTDHRVDAVLCGHVHERVEFRVRPDNNGLNYFTDFYTENPSTYRESYDWLRPHPGGLLDPIGDIRPIHLTISPDATPRDTVRVVKDPQPNGSIESRELRVPPYPDPLNDVDPNDAPDWWSRHRPLILQTSCLGPIDYSQRGLRPTEGNTIAKGRVSFQGVRLLRVSGNAITRISYVGIDAIREGLPPRPGIPRNPVTDFPGDLRVVDDAAPVRDQPIVQPPRRVIDSP